MEIEIIARTIIDTVLIFLSIAVGYTIFSKVVDIVFDFLKDVLGERARNIILTILLAFTFLSYFFMCFK